MRIRGIIGLVLIVALCGCKSDLEDLQMSVERCASAPIAVTSAACFVFEGQGYVFGGRLENDSLINHMYRYSPNTDQWVDLGETPLQARVRPRAVCIGQDVYMGLGFNGHVLGDTAYLADWWRWTPATNTWTELTPYPSDHTVGPVVATDGEYIYAADGGKWNFERWIFRYDITNDKWVKLADGLPRMASYPPRAHSASGAMCGGHFFIGAGYTRDGSSDFWTEAELTSDSIIWHRHTALNGRRHNATATSDNRYVYLAGGHLYGGTLTTGLLYDDILRYDPIQDSWVRLGHMPDNERENMISWIIGNQLYIGLGNDKRNHPCAQLYRLQL